MAQTLANNIVSSYSYNQRSFLTDLLNKGGSTTLSEFGGSTPSTKMAYDALGDLTSVKASLPAAPASYSGTTTYQYDGKTELTQEATTRGGGFTHAFGYDNAENPTQFRSVAQPVASPDNQVGGAYDGNGNPSFVDGASAGFDVENRATNIGTLSETWGGNGLRASENGATYYLYDGSVPVCELSSTGTVTATNTFGASGLVSRHTSSGSVFYTFDPMGNVAQRYTSTGSLVSSDLYDSFGSATSTATPTDPFGYEGKFGYYTEHGTSLILCGHRFYDTSTGRFINRDPIGYAGGINLYGYAGNNAANAVDPSGLSTVDLNVSVNVFDSPVFVGGGIQIDGAAGTYSWYVNAGGSVGPPVSGSAQFSTGKTAGGVFVGVFGGYILGASAGIGGLGTGKASGYVTGGVSSPTAGGVVGYVFPSHPISPVFKPIFSPPPSSPAISIPPWSPTWPLLPTVPGTPQGSGPSSSGSIGLVPPTTPGMNSGC